MVANVEGSAPVDLHTHSTYSDGTYTPIELLHMAAANGLAGIAIADHDTIGAYREPELAGTASLLGVELVPAVEVSTIDDGGRRIHVLGLFIDPHNGELDSWLQGLQTSRQDYTRQVIGMLGAAGWQVDMPMHEGQTITKAHIADAVVGVDANLDRLLSQFESMPTRGAFIERFMNEGKPFFVRRESVTPQEAIEVIHDAGGLTFFAHPVAGVYEQGMSYLEIAQKAKDYGFDGIEALYYYFSKSDKDCEINEIAQFETMAHDLGLLVSGGSDFHGSDASIGNFIDIGYPNRDVFPTLDLMQGLRTAAELRKAASRT